MYDTLLDSMTNRHQVANVAGWSSPAAREAHNLEVVGSNPAPATCICWILRTSSCLHSKPMFSQPGTLAFSLEIDSANGCRAGNACPAGSETAPIEPALTIGISRPTVNIWRKWCDDPVCFAIDEPQPRRRKRRRRDRYYYCEQRTGLRASPVSDRTLQP